MKKYSLKQKLGLGIFAVLLAFGLAAGPAQVFAAPATGTNPAVTAQTTQDKTTIRDQKIARIKALLDKVNKRIDTVKDKLAKAKTDAQKARLQKRLDRLQTFKQKLEARLDHLQNPTNNQNTPPKS